jgi:hypothetical protein
MSDISLRAIGKVLPQVALGQITMSPLQRDVGPTDIGKQGKAVARLSGCCMRHEC